MPYTLRDGPGFQLLRTAALFKHAFAKALRPYDITPVQFALLGLLWERDGLNQHEIATLLGKDRPNITRILEKLELKGMVVRERDPEDRRSTRVFLSPLALQQRRELESVALDFRAHALEGLAESERTILQQLLLRLMENLR
ncbi:MarR family winged helix-turn-helix transcriptional regulator [Sedimenticola sp.]|uniref:MarR family winged helix-turn-helix transcriptional regulator n=1 Tax=Sedimenticola sp. TaxID=1940285 RepID=UPI003D1323F0